MNKWFVGVILLVILSVLGLSFLISYMAGVGIIDGRKNVAVIEINGPISGERQKGLFSVENVATSPEIVKLIKKADEDILIDGILIKINSPGGTVVASKEIGNAVKRAKKPTVAVIREVGASGGYWIASATDYIIADELSITGSIGVLSGGLEFSQLMEKYGVAYNRLVAGKYKDTGTPYRNMTNEEKNLLLGKLDIIHEAFIREVANNRNLSYGFVKNISTGEFFLGVQAKQYDLIDELGNTELATEYLKNKLNATDIHFVEFKIKRSLFESFASIFSEGMFSLGSGMSSNFLAQNNEDVIQI